MIYTHYICVVYLAVLGVGIFFYNRKIETFFKNATISIAIIICSYIPWIPYAIADFLGGPTAYTGGQLNLIVFIYWSFYFFVAPVPSYIQDPYVLRLIIYTFLINLPLIIVSLIGFIGFIYTYKNKNYFTLKSILDYTVLMTIMIFGIQLVIGFIIPNTFQAKNLIGGLTLVHVIEAFGLYYLIIDDNSIFNQNLKKFLKIINPRLFKRLFYTLIISVTICSVIIFPIFKTAYLQKPDWNGCVKTLKKEYKSHEIVINQYGVNKLPEVMAYYCDLHDFNFDDNTYELKYDDDHIKEFLEFIAKEEITRIWIVSYWKHVVDPDDKTVEKLEDELELDNKELEKIEKYEFRLDLTLTLYEIQPIS